MDLSIIIINYKSTQLVLDCLDSVYRQTHQYSFEIIIVDNNSADQSKEQITSLYPLVHWLQMDYNAGFARANNKGMKIANGTHILLLNADTIILDNAIDKSIALLKQHTEAVACGVQLLNTDGTTQISGAHIIKGGLNTLLPLPYLGKLIRWLGYTFKSTIPSVQTIQDKIEVDWIVGAYILVRKEILLKSGYFDDDFFMYAEEIEWCGRLGKQGKLYLFEAPKVIHIGGGTSNDYYNTTESENGKNLWSKKGRQVVVSNMLRIRKQFGIFWYLLVVGAYLFEIPVFVLCLFVDKLYNRNKAKYSWLHFSNYLLTTITLFRYFFRIFINKPYFYKLAR
jgi:GT2 family glycosyltransferase